MAGSVGPEGNMGAPGVKGPRGDAGREFQWGFYWNGENVKKSPQLLWRIFSNNVFFQGYLVLLVLLDSPASLEKLVKEEHKVQLVFPDLWVFLSL